MLAILRYSSFVNILTYWQTFLLDGNNLSSVSSKQTRNLSSFFKSTVEKLNIWAQKTFVESDLGIHEGYCQMQKKY